MAAHQFRDLPQIPQALDEPRFPTWGVESYGYTNLYKQDSVHYQAEGDVYFGDFDNGAVSMQPMERFMQDQYPLTPGLLHANIPVQHQLRLQYEPQWPSTNIYRNPSPDRTSASDNSTYDLHSPHMYHADPYGSPTDGYSPSSLPYPTIEDFKEGGYASFPLLPSGNSVNICNLRDIEIEHRVPEPEAAVDDIGIVALKQETVVDHDTIAVKTESTPSDDSKDYPDSGIGNSVRDAESVQPMDIQDIPEDPASDSDYSPTTSSRSSKRRRSSASNSSTSRVSKRGSISKPAAPAKASKKIRRNSNAAKKQIEVDEDRRPFPCALTHYGCASTFSSKNEWKRHVSTQHIKLSFWRCDLCPVSTDAKDDQTVYYNDFNRKDLFTQHLRRMHAAPKESSARTQKEYPVTEDNLADHQDRCVQRLRKAPSKSGCLFCEKTFEGPTSWEERMEHIGHHLENHGKVSIDLLDTTSWNADKKLEQYLVEEGLIVMDHTGWKIGNGKPVRLDYDSNDDSDEE